jgi:hypothetical protein
MSCEFMRILQTIYHFKKCDEIVPLWRILASEGEPKTIIK